MPVRRWAIPRAIVPQVLEAIESSELFHQATEEELTVGRVELEHETSRLFLIADPLWKINARSENASGVRVRYTIELRYEELQDGRGLLELRWNDVLRNIVIVSIVAPLIFLIVFFIVSPPICGLDNEGLLKGFLVARLLVSGLFAWAVTAAVISWQGRCRRLFRKADATIRGILRPHAIRMLKRRAAKQVREAHGNQSDATM